MVRPRPGRFGRPLTDVELRRYLSILRSRAWSIVATVVAPGAAGYGGSDTEAGTVAQTTIYVGASSIAADPVPGELSNDRLTAIQLMVLNFAKMIDSETIARSALADLGLERDPSEVVESTTAEPEPGTQLLYVTVTDPDPEMAQTLANGLADTFVEEFQAFGPGLTEGTVPQNGKASGRERGCQHS